MFEKAETLIISEELEVRSRLNDFGLSKNDIAKICQSAISGKSLSSASQPKTAEGHLKYIFGVEGLRDVCLEATKVNYESFSKNNLEGVYDAKNSRKLMFQMVNIACGTKYPQPRSKIGKAKKRFIENSKQPSLFPEYDNEDKVVVEFTNGLASAECWYIMVSIDESNVVCCELSRPKAVDENDMFLGFHERIQIFKYGEFKLEDNLNDDDEDNNDAFEIKPSITKKK